MHQRADRKSHKLHCNLIKDAHEKLRREEAALRAHSSTDDPALPADPFTSAAGHFWAFPPTRPYMDARLDLVINQLNVRTGEAVEAALANVLDMLRLSRADGMGVRSQVPALYLRLGRDQEAYDFLRWYSDKAPSYDWEDVEQPFLDVKGADALERIDPKSGLINTDLSFKVALLLLKSRLFADVSQLEGFLQKLGDKAPRDRMEIVREECLSDVMLNRRDIVDADDYVPIMVRLRRQMVSIYEDIKKSNRYMIPALENPGRYANAQPGPYTPGDEGEAALAFRYSWYSWAECPNVLNEILPLLKDA